MWVLTRSEVTITDIQLTSLTKILKCAKDNDVVTLKAADEADNLGLVFESPSTCVPSLRATGADQI